MKQAILKRIRSTVKTLEAFWDGLREDSWELYCLLSLLGVFGLIFRPATRIYVVRFLLISSLLKIILAPLAHVGTEIMLWSVVPSGVIVIHHTVT